MLNFIATAFRFFLITIALLFLIRWVGDAGRVCRLDSRYGRDHYVCWKMVVFEGDDFFSFLRVRRLFPGS